MSPRSPHRFYFAGHLAGPCGQAVALSAEESHHLTHVLRLRPGTQIDVFDASGHSFAAEVLDGSGKQAQVRLLEQNEEEAQDHLPVVNLAVAVLKRRAMDWLVEKISELGVDMLQPLITARSIAGGRESDSEVPSRWERLTIAAAKQCGRNRPLVVAPPASLAAWLARPRPPAHTVYAHGPSSVPIGHWLAERSGVEAQRWVAIGPEGGWTPEEVAMFERAGFRPVSLGDLTLRAETAALAAAAVCRLG